MKKEKIKTIDGQTLLDTVIVPAPQNIVTIVTVEFLPPCRAIFGE